MDDLIKRLEAEAERCNGQYQDCRDLRDLLLEAAEALRGKQ